MKEEQKNRDEARPLIDWAARHQAVLAVTTLMVGAFVLYANTFGHQWVYDDLVVLVRNPDIRSWSEFWQNSYAGRPLRELTYLLEYQLFELNPSGYHVQNIFWHGLNAVLLFFVVSRLGCGRAAAWCAAVVFLVHPLQVEVVANISHRKDSLVLAFSMLALLAYMKACEREGRRRLLWLAGVLVLAVTAYMGKQTAVALLPLFVAYDMAFVAPDRRILLRRPRWFWSTTVVAAAGFGWWVYSAGLFQRRYWELQGVMTKLGHFSTISEDMYLATLLKAFVFMGRRILVPVDLGVEYSFQAPTSWFDPSVLVGIAIWLMFFSALALSLRRAPAVFLGLVWAVAFWLPVSGLWPLTYIVADRYLYAPLAGLAIIAGIAFGKCLKRWPRSMAVAFPAVVLILSILTWKQSLVWRTPLSLWSHAVSVSPESSYALSSLGKVYINRGQPALALPLLKKAAAKNPYNQDVRKALSYAERMLRFSGRRSPPR